MTDKPMSPSAPSSTKNYPWESYKPSEAQLERFRKFKEAGGEVPEIKGIVMGGKFTDLMKSFFTAWKDEGLPTGNGNFPIDSPAIGFSPEDIKQLKKGFGRVNMSSAGNHAFLVSPLGPDHDIVSVSHGVPRTRVEYAKHWAELNAKDSGDVQKAME